MINFQMYMLKLLFITMINNYKHVHITFDLGKSRGFVDLLGTLLHELSNVISIPHCGHTSTSYGYMVIWHGILQNCRNIQGLAKDYERCIKSVRRSGSRRACESLKSSISLAIDLLFWFFIMFVHFNCF